MSIPQDIAREADAAVPVRARSMPVARRTAALRQRVQLGRIAGLTGSFGSHRPQRLVILERPSRHLPARRA